VILLQLKSKKLKLEVFKSDFQRKKKDMNTVKLVIHNWQNFARVRLQLTFTVIIQTYYFQKVCMFQIKYWEGLQKNQKA